MPIFVFFFFLCVFHQLVEGKAKVLSPFALILTEQPRVKLPTMSIHLRFIPRSVSTPDLETGLTGAEAHLFSLLAESERS